MEARGAGGGSGLAARVNIREKHEVRTDVRLRVIADSEDHRGPNGAHLKKKTHFERQA